ncbi:MULTISPECIES: TldD/PmbA family protein [Tissierellales]|jgi:TldD protein|uniref:TldD/PmbA family protein n=1 Tax=Acidilutibacter cellobiosedens TaxID=2507161 RepID=A0A410Q9X3_9FIRM|nr:MULTISPECIES: TldD/PmbA family protein [Tissierellales]QAT60780.1 TldD/PmbA family protein [Acidilutibacter cellobiosedens]SCL87615.1 protease TldD [Sporanaerobacter sp. PP17-6a]
MFIFPKDLYTDVRIENVYSTEIFYENGKLRQNLKRDYKGAFIRVFDGKRWFYCSTTDIDNIQKEIDNLAKMAVLNKKIGENPVVKMFQINKGVYYRFNDNNILDIKHEDKVKLLKSYFPFLSGKEELKTWKAFYIDNRTDKEFYSSKGADLKFDYQTCAVVFRYSLNINEKTFNGRYDKTSTDFNELKGLEDEIGSVIKRDIEYVKESKPVIPGKYTVVFSPIATGVFTHESFGHKSESDFMVGDETMMKEWALGKTVGVKNLSIVDRGDVLGRGFVPFDDEGTKATKTYLVKNGILSGRLHSSVTASKLEEQLTGNARAVNFEFEPIVRMTNTYIEAGDKSKDEIISEVDKGILIVDINHGSGMSTFTIAPNICYMIRNGKIAEPVNVAVISGNVMETLNEIDGISDEIELMAFSTGGCGKMEQFPLPVGFGGPYIRVNNINVQ